MPAAVLLGGSVIAGLLSASLGGDFGAFLPAAGLAGLILLAISLALPEVGVAATLAACALFQREELFEFSLPFFGGGLKPPDLLLLLVFAGFAIRWVMRPDLRQPVPKTAFRVIIPFVVWAILSAGIGISRGIPYKDSLVELRPLLQYLLFIPVVAQFGRTHVWRVLLVLLAVSNLVACKALWYYSRGIGATALYTSADVVRVMNVEFSYLLIALLLAAALYFEGTYKLLAVITLVLTAAALVITFYRSAVLGLAAALAFMLLAASKHIRRRALKAGLAGAIVILFCLPAAIQFFPRALVTIQAFGSRILSIGEYKEDTSAQHRFNEWAASVDLIRRHPVLGNGLGTRIRFFSPMYLEGMSKMGYWSEDFYTHNSYVWITTKMGGVGLALFLGLLLYVLHSGWALIKQHSPDVLTRALALGLTSCWVALIVISFFGPMHNTPNTAPFVGISAGCLFVLARAESRQFA